MQNTIPDPGEPGNHTATPVQSPHTGTRGAGLGHTQLPPITTKNTAAGSQLNVPQPDPILWDELMQNLEARIPKSEFFTAKPRLSETYFDRPSMAIRYDWPPGMAGDLARYFYDSALRPVPEIAVVTTLGLLAGICGKAYVTPNKPTGLNMYIILVASSGVGKEAMHGGISSLIKRLNSNPKWRDAKRFVDTRDFVSGPALQKACIDSPCFVNVCGEFGQRLKQIAESHRSPGSPMQTLRRIMTNLYSKSGPDDVAAGMAYSNPIDNVESTEGVAFSMIGETTPGTFFETITPDMMADGFMSRFTIVEYEGLRPPKNQKAHSLQSPDGDLWGQFTFLIETVLSSNQPISVNPDAGAAELLDAFDLECDNNINGTNDESNKQMWNRAHLKVLKLACLLAVANDPTEPTMTTAEVEWALLAVRRDIGVFAKRLSNGDVGSGDDAREQKLLAFSRDYLLADNASKGVDDIKPMHRDGIITRQYLQRKTAGVAAFKNHPLGAKRALDDAIKGLMDNGALVEANKLTMVQNYSFHGKAYRILNAGPLR